MLTTKATMWGRSQGRGWLAFGWWVMDVGGFCPRLMVATLHHGVCAKLYFVAANLRLIRWAPQSYICPEEIIRTVRETEPFMTATHVNKKWVSPGGNRLKVRRRLMMPDLSWHLRLFN